MKDIKTYINESSKNDNNSTGDSWVAIEVVMPNENSEDGEKEKAKLFYKLVTPVDHDVDIEDVLNRVNVVVVRNFNKMISGELGA